MKKLLYIIILLLSNVVLGQAFITTWQTTTSNETVTIPTFTGETYNYSVDWGDGASDADLTGDAVHTYSMAGTYTVTITGTFPRIFFNDGGDKGKIRTIEQWGSIQWTSMEGAFDGASLALNATDAPDLSNVTSLARMFRNNNVIASPNMSGWDVSRVTNMSSTFEGVSSFNGDVTQWDTRRVFDMSLLFAGAESFNQDIGGWNTSNVEFMPIMFFGAFNFNQDIGGWDVSKVKNFGQMFVGATNFDQDLSAWDISSANNLESFIDGAAMSIENYDKLLRGFATLDEGELRIPTGLTFGADGKNFCDGVLARQQLANTYSWTITDAGQSCTDLIAYYPFNGDVNDASGNGNNATRNGPITNPDRFGNAGGAYSFDGVDDVIVLPISAANLNNEFTISSWVRRTKDIAGGGEVKMGIVSGAISGNMIGAGLTINGNAQGDTFQGQFWNGSGERVAAGGESVFGDWMQAVLVYDGPAATATLYVDGQQVNVQTSIGSGNVSGGGSFIVGRNNEQGLTDEFFGGGIDDLRIYNRALSSAEVQDLYEQERVDPLDDGLVAYYPFSVGAMDDSGNENNGNSVGGIGVTDRLGNPDSAFGLDGVDDYITVPDDPTLDLTNFTLAGWMYMDKPVPEGEFWNLFFKGESGDPAVTNYAFSVNSSQNLSVFYEYSSGDNVSLAGTTSIESGQWYHFSSTYDGANLRLYIDGAQEATLAEANAPGNNNDPLIIGSNDLQNSFLSGKLDELRIYDRAFTAGEIQELYDLEKPPAFSDGLLASYTFNGNANDDSGNGTDAVVVNATPATDRFDEANAAYSFDGNDDFISTNSFGFEPENLTLSAWFNYPAGGADATHQIVEIAGSSALALLEGQAQTVLNLGGQFLTTEVAVAPDSWHNLTLTYDGSNYYSYLDGELVNEIVNAGPIEYAIPNASIVIGSAGGGASFFNGSIDDILIYERALTPEQVRDLYRERGYTEIAGFSFGEQTGAAEINHFNRTISIDVQHGFNLHTLIPTINNYSNTRIWFGDTQYQAGVTGFDFSRPITFDVRPVSNSEVTLSSYEVTVTQSHPSSINFEDVFTTSLTEDFDWVVGSTWADYNNDNYPDVFLNTWDFDNPTNFSNRLFLNNQSGGFVDVSDRLPVDSWATANSVDYNDDGQVDIVGGAASSDWDTDANKMFFTNEGNASTFTRQDLTVPSSIGAEGQLVWNSGWADYDNDGDLDVLHLLENDDFINRFFVNNGDGTFTENNSLAISSVAGGSLDVAWPDIDNDGDADLFVANGANGVVNDELYINNGDGTFTQVTTGAIVNDGVGSEGASWGDFNNDGFIDLLMVSQNKLFLYVNNGNGTFSSIENALTQQPYGGIGSAIGDYDNDGDLDVFVGRENGGGANRIFENDGTGEFTEIVGTLVNEVASSWGVTWVDYDRDGQLDLFVGNANQRNYLYRNTGTGNNYIGIKLEGDESNSQGIGARIVVKADVSGTGEVSQMRQVLSTSGSRSQQESVIHVGLGSASFIENITVYWPSGRVNSLNGIAINQYIAIEENDGLLAYYPYNGNSNDESNNNIVGFPEGGVSLTSDRLNNPNKAYSFNGVDGRITSFHLPQPEQITVSGWFQTTGDYSGAYANIIDIEGILGLGLGSTNNIGGIIQLGGNFIPINGSTVVNDGVWHNTSLTFDGSTIKLYLDGAMVEEISGQTDPIVYSTANQILQIGYSFDGSADRWFDGSIDEVRIYDRALTDQEILDLYNAEKPLEGIVAQYNFLAGDASDLTGNGYNGTVSGATSINDRFGEPNAAFAFDGVENIIELANTAPFSAITDEFTYSSWIRPAEFKTGEMTIIANSTGSEGIGFLMSNVTSGNIANELKIEVGGVDFTIGGFPELDEWSHVVATFKNGEELALYLNGSLAGAKDISSSGTSPQISTSENYTIGKGAQGAFSGGIDDLKIFNRALTADDVQALYDQERPPEGNTRPSDISLSSTSIGEQQPINTLIGQFTTVDEDEADTHSYSFVSGDGDTDNASFVLAGDQLFTGEVFDLATKSSYSIRVQTDDGNENGTFSKQFTISITEVTGGEPTAIDLSANTIAENSAVGTLIGDLSTTDPDDPVNDDVYTYSIVGGDGEDFDIQNGNQLVSQSVFDFETKSEYSITVRTLDQGNQSLDVDLTINVTNEGPQPGDLILSNSAIIQGAAGNTTVGTFEVAGEEARATYGFSITGGDSGFALAQNGTLTIEEGVAAGTYGITVQAADSGGPDQVESQFDIVVTSVDPSSSVSFGSNVSNYRIIGIPSASANVSTVFPDLASSDRLTGWRIVSYANSNISDLNTTSSMTAGRGYWFLSSQSTTISLAGLAPVQEAEVSVQLGTEWNLISNPFLETLDMSGAIAYNISQGFIQSGDVSDVFDHNPNVVNSLRVFQGGWIRNTTGSNLTIRLPNPSSNAQGRIAAEQFRVTDSWVKDQENWQLLLLMQDRDRISNLGAVGMNSSALVGIDELDMIAPPPIAEELLFKMSDQYGLVRNFQPYSNNAEWSYQIQAPRHNTVTISWDTEIVRSLDQGLYLFDPIKQISYDMSVVQSVELPANAPFEVLYGEAVDRETVRVPMTVYPNPTSDRLFVRFFAEGEDEEIRAKMTIFNVDGRILRSVEQSFSSNAVGTFELLDLNLSAGTYFIQVSHDSKRSHTQKIIVK